MNEVPDYMNQDKEEVLETLNGRLPPDQVIDWLNRTAAADPEDRQKMLKWLKINMLRDL